MCMHVGSDVRVPPSSLTQGSGTWLHVCQMLPIIVLLLTSVFSSVLFSPFFPSQPYALEKTRYSPQGDKAYQLTYGPNTSACIIILDAFVDGINCLFGVTNYTLCISASTRPCLNLLLDIHVL